MDYINFYMSRYEFTSFGEFWPWILPLPFPSSQSVNELPLFILAMPAVEGAEL